MKKQYKVLNLDENTIEKCLNLLHQYLNDGWVIERADSPHIGYAGGLAYHIIYILSKSE